MSFSQQLNRRILIERPVATPEPEYGKKEITWEPFITVWASVRDVLMSARGGGETSVHGDLRLLVRPCRVVIRYRPTVTTLMRVTLLHENRVMQIVSIAEIGNKTATELQCEEFSS
jgi:head-tail adaptor